jgi:hypothetical protein
VSEGAGQDPEMAPGGGSFLPLLFFDRLKLTVYRCRAISLSLDYLVYIDDHKFGEA